MNVPDHVIRTIIQRFGFRQSLKYHVQHVSTNTIVELRNGLLIRIAPNTASHMSQTHVDNIQFLSMHTPVLAPLSTEIVHIDDYAATLWPKCNDRLHDYRSFAQALSRLHAVKMLPNAVPRFNLMSKLYTRLQLLDKHGDVPSDTVAILKEKTQQLRRAHDDMLQTSDIGLMHGDAHPGNFVFAHKSGYLIDLDSMCWGPVQYDYIPMLVRAKRMNKTQAYKQLIQHSRDFDDQWKHKETAIRLRELTMTSHLGTLWNVSLRHRDEYLLRIHTLCDDYDMRQWSIPS